MSPDIDLFVLWASPSREKALILCRVSRVLRTLPNEAVSAVADFAEGLLGGVASAIVGSAQWQGVALRNGTEVCPLRI